MAGARMYFTCEERWAIHSSCSLGSFSEYTAMPTLFQASESTFTVFAP